MTFCALYLMEMGQPALLYLVPFTLVTTFVIGCIRGEARSLWSGFSKKVLHIELIILKNERNEIKKIFLNFFQPKPRRFFFSSLYLQIED